MSKVNRGTPEGRAFLDLQNHARREGLAMQQVLTFYALERWLARLATSTYAENFILKGGMLLAAVDARRPTVDADTMADPSIAKITAPPRRSRNSAPRHVALISLNGSGQGPSR